jgi:hypothetical protein
LKEGNKMTKEKATQKNLKKSRSPKRGYDFKDNDPKRVLTRTEIAHLDECMRPKNESIPADQMDVEGAAEAVIAKMRRKYS